SPNATPGANLALVVDAAVVALAIIAPFGKHFFSHCLDLDLCATALGGSRISRSRYSSFGFAFFILSRVVVARLFVETMTICSWFKTFQSTHDSTFYRFSYCDRWIW